MKTSFDFAPFTRSTVGFDRIFDLLDNTRRLSTASHHLSLAGRALGPQVHSKLSSRDVAEA
jgi:hypothetical protein